LKDRELKAKLRIYWYIVMGLLVILVLRLAVVQFVQSETYETLSKFNRIRLVSIKAPRGEIYSADGEVLAKNQLVYTVSLTYLGVTNQDTVVARLAELLNEKHPEITVDYIQDLIEKQKYRLYEPITVIRDIDWETVVKLEERRQELPGVTVTVEPLRYYPQDTLTGHVLGYVRGIDPAELAELDKERYGMGDLVGKDGVEKSYENYLKGYDGARRVEVDVRERPVKELVTLEPQAGNNLHLTIDAELQKVMEKSMVRTLESVQRNQNRKARVASCVLMNVKTGEILAMGSYPFFNPNDFTGFMDKETGEYYFPGGDYDPMNPGAATNRAIKAVYPPGSTFKAITALAALESGKMSPAQDYINCQGAYWIKPRIKCWQRHGPVNLYRGMAVSCNTYFQEMGRRAGQDGIIKVAREFGLGEKTGIDLPYEKSGLLPTPEWKQEISSILVNKKYQRLREELNARYDDLLAGVSDEEEKRSLLKKKQSELARLEANYKIDYRFETNWQAFDTFNMSIGQGSNTYTVLQLANYMATIANGGHLMKPFVVKKVVSPSGSIILENHPELVQEADVSAENLAETRTSLLKVTQAGGTAYGLFAHFPPEIQVAAKTGTAQTGRRGDKKNEEFHGVFIAFAPFDDPEIAFAGVVEYGKSGSGSAGLIARDLFEHYFKIKDHLQEAQDVQKVPSSSPPRTPAAPAPQEPASEEVTEEPTPPEETAAPPEETEVISETAGDYVEDQEE
jgi:penicillin-binding protein 2